MVLCTACDPFKDRGCNVFLYKNTRRHYKSPNNNLRTFVEFLDQWIYALFRPAPPRTAPRIFTLAPPHPAPPRGFLPLPRPAPQKNAPPRASLIHTQSHPNNTYSTTVLNSSVVVYYSEEGILGVGICVMEKYTIQHSYALHSDTRSTACVALVSTFSTNNAW